MRKRAPGTLPCGCCSSYKWMKNHQFYLRELREDYAFPEEQTTFTKTKRATRNARKKHRKLYSYYPYTWERFQKYKPTKEEDEQEKLFKMQQKAKCQQYYGLDWLTFKSTIYINNEAQNDKKTLLTQQTEEERIQELKSSYPELQESKLDLNSLSNKAQINLFQQYINQLSERRTNSQEYVANALKDRKSNQILQKYYQNTFDHLDITSKKQLKQFEELNERINQDIDTKWYLSFVNGRVINWAIVLQKMYQEKILQFSYSYQGDFDRCYFLNEEYFVIESSSIIGEKISQIEIQIYQTPFNELYKYITDHRDQEIVFENLSKPIRHIKFQRNFQSEGLNGNNLDILNKSDEDSWMSIGSYNSSECSEDQNYIQSQNELLIIECKNLNSKSKRPRIALCESTKNLIIFEIEGKRIDVLNLFGPEQHQMELTQNVTKDYKLIDSTMNSIQLVLLSEDKNSSFLNITPEQIVEEKNENQTAQTNLDQSKLLTEYIDLNNNKLLAIVTQNSENKLQVQQTSLNCNKEQLTKSFEIEITQNFSTSLQIRCFNVYKQFLIVMRSNNSFQVYNLAKDCKLEFISDPIINPSTLIKSAKISFNLTYMIYTYSDHCSVYQIKPLIWPFYKSEIVQNDRIDQEQQNSNLKYSAIAMNEKDNSKIYFNWSKAKVKIFESNLLLIQAFEQSIVIDMNFQLILPHKQEEQIYTFTFKQKALNEKIKFTPIKCSTHFSQYPADFHKRRAQELTWIQYLPVNCTTNYFTQKQLASYKGLERVKQEKEKYGILYEDYKASKNKGGKLKREKNVRKERMQKKLEKFF